MEKPGALAPTDPIPCQQPDHDRFAGVARTHAR